MHNIKYYQFPGSIIHYKLFSFVPQWNYKVLQFCSLVQKKYFKIVKETQNGFCSYSLESSATELIIVKIAIQTIVRHKHMLLQQKNRIQWHPSGTDPELIKHCDDYFYILSADENRYIVVTFKWIKLVGDHQCDVCASCSFQLLQLNPFLSILCLHYTSILYVYHMFTNSYNQSKLIEIERVFQTRCSASNELFKLVGSTRLFFLKRNIYKGM